MSSPDVRASHLRSLHKPGRPLVLANVYDAASANIVASDPSSTAVATSSAAIAAVNGLEDNDLDLETHISALKKIIPAQAGFTLNIYDIMQVVAVRSCENPFSHVFMRDFYPAT